VNAKWTSSLGEFTRKLEEAQKKGLVAAAQVYVNEVKRGLRGGYTSGAFVTGESINRVTRGEPEQEAGGEWYIRVGTTLLFNLFWELGHHNIFTRHFEQKQVWGPVFEETQDAQREAYVKVMRRVLDKG
jgi:hypothetical protein